MLRLLSVLWALTGLATGLTTGLLAGPAAAAATVETGAAAYVEDAAAAWADELRERIALQQPVGWQPAVLSPAGRRWSLTVLTTGLPEFAQGSCHNSQ